MEWLTATNSQSKGPKPRRSPSRTRTVRGRMPCSLSLASRERQGQLGADEGNVRPLAQQVRHAADVVLVAVGEDHGHDVVQPVPDRGEVRQDHVHAGLGLLGEQYAAVDDEQFARVLEDGHVCGRSHPGRPGR